MFITVYLNQTPGARFRTSLAAQLANAGMYEAHDYLSDGAALEAAFAVFNSAVDPDYPEEFFGPREIWAIEACLRYREQGHRSLSVGDVVALHRHGQDSVFYECDNSGFLQVDVAMLDLSGRIQQEAS